MREQQFTSPSRRTIMPSDTELKIHRRSVLATLVLSCLFCGLAAAQYRFGNRAIGYGLPQNSEISPKSNLPAETKPNEDRSGALRVGLARPGLFKVNPLGADQGLEKTSILSIVQDRTGLLWLATSNGVYKYDGYDFTAYRRTPAGQKALLSDNVEAVYEDHTGELWIGHQQGLSKFDRDTNTFQDVALPFLPSKDVRAKNAQRVSVIYEDRRQALWVGTRNGLYQLERGERTTGQWRSFAHDPQTPGSLSADNISSICEDRKGELWVATFGGGLNRFERARAEFSVFRHRSQDPHSLACDEINKLAAAPDGSLWIATESAGLDRFNPESQTFSHYRHSARDPHSLAGDNVGAVYVDHQGRPWVGVGFFGLARLDTQTGRFTQFKQESSRSSHLKMALYEDREGTLWVGDRGLSKLEQRKESVTVFRNNPLNKNSLSDDGVRAIWEDRQGRLWVGTQNGLSLIERATGRVRRYLHDPRNPHSLAQNFVSQIYEDRAGQIWIATSHNKLEQYDPARDGFTHWLPAPGLRNELKADNTRSIRSIHEDSRGQLWLAVYDEGLCRLDRTTRQLTCHRYRDNDPRSLSADRTQHLYETRDGVLWVSTSKGLNRFDRETERFTRFTHDGNDPRSLGSNDVEMMLEDRAGNFWLATHSGLNLMDRATGRFTRFTEKDGLCDNALAGLAEDAEGNLWLSAETCLARFNPRTRNFRNFTAQDGAEFSGFRPRVCFRSPRGEMFFGGDGVLSFLPEQLKENSLPPPVLLTSFSKFNQPVDLGRTLSSLPELKLSWRDDFFSFEFAALSYVEPEKNQYAYRMEDFDQDWVHCGTRRYASYTNLPAGTYLFRVKAANSDGVWNEVGASLRVVVVPPFHSTWWFRSLAALGVAALVVLIFRWREAQLRKEHATQEAFSRQLLTAQEAFSRRLIDSQEQERQRIAAELHDGLGQNLLVIKNYALMALNTGDGKNPAREHLNEISDAATLSIEEVRQIAHNLRPYQLERLGLTNTLQSMLRQIANASDIGFTSEVDPVDGLLSKEAEISLYRIVQEAINNILKHSGATEASVRINRAGDEIQVTIADDGRGFRLEPAGHAELQKRGFGLAGSAERVRMLGGTQTIQTAPGRGTTIHITIPTNKHASKQ
jgi:two-component system sensor histidine kinase ChiS